MNKQLLSKIKESLFSVLPISFIVILLHFTKIAPLTKYQFISFIVATIVLIFGIGLFTLGADIAMSPIGEYIGTGLMKSRKIWLIVFTIFILGVLITIAEPDLSVLTNQVPVNPNLLKWSIGIGVGLFLVLAVLRIMFKLDFRNILIISYALIFILMIFTNNAFLPLSFDSGGVTTGPITVPFIMALGLGIASTVDRKHSRESSFGLVALASAGPILAVLIIGIFIKGAPLYEPSVFSESTPIFQSLLHHAIKYVKNVGIVLLPIIAFFYIFNLIFLKLPKQKLLKILIGVTYTYVGLIMFLTAVDVGYMPVGNQIGSYIGASNYSWLLVPLGLIMGFVVVLAEPAVHVLNKQVEDISSGTISRRSMLIGLSIGVGISIALSMVRIIFSFNILYYIIPGYALSIIISFFVPKIYTAIAFDSGGVASGPMTAGFILPFAIGACTSLLGNDRIMEGAFGVVALVAMTPLVTIQLLGVSAVLRDKLAKKAQVARVPSNVIENQIIYFD